MQGDSKTLIFDIGSYNSRVGFAGNEEPAAIFPTVVGRRKFQNALAGISEDRIMVGFDASPERGVTELVEPVKQGLVTDFGAWSSIVRHAVDVKLGVDVRDFFTIFSAPIRSPHSNEQKMAEILFEEFQVKGAAGVLAPTLSLMAAKRDTGLVVDLGHGQTQIVPIIQGSWIEEASVRSEVAGQSLNTAMSRILTEQSPGFFDPKHARNYSIDTLKKTCAYVALDYDAEMEEMKASDTKAIDFEFNDGSSLTLRSERIRAAECLFRTAFLGSEQEALHKLIYRAVLRCPMDTRKELLENIVITGGTSMLHGLIPRLEKELSALALSKVRLVAGNDRANYTWTGASRAASLLHTIMTKQQYEEYGASAFHRFGALTTTRYDQLVALPTATASV